MNNPVAEIGLARQMMQYVEVQDDDLTEEDIHLLRIVIDSLTYSRKSFDNARRRILDMEKYTTYCRKTQ